jgi:hypothetical protein
MGFDAMKAPISKLAKKYPKKRCPVCRKVAGAHIIRGYPVSEMFELELYGHVVLLGCEPPLAGEPEFNFICKNCGHNWE